MANRVRISIVAPPRLTDDFGIGQKAVDHMVEHWKSRLELVLPDEPDLIVVPEVCDRYAHHSSEQARQYYEVRRDQVQQAFSRTAQAGRCYVAYSAFRRSNEGPWRNSTLMVDRTGHVFGTYDKNHPTLPQLEDGETPGRDAVTFSCDFGSVACAICFDLNFDELRLKYAVQKPDLVLFASLYHGGLMQAYWAYSCRSHFVGAVAGLPSAILNPAGHVVAVTTNYHHYVTATVNLDCRLVHLDFNWAKLEALKRKYGPGVSVFDPGLLGSVLVTSEADDKTVDELLAEFEIEALDDYFARSLRHQQQSAE